jgi:sirohydrochlorin ferrochelatase
VADALICLAHGSRHPRADAAVAAVAAAAGGIPAYLDFSPLTWTTVSHLLAARGERAATVVPLLFTRAFHLRHDVPAAIDAAQRETGVRLHLAGGIGTGDDLAGVLAGTVADAAARAGAPEFILYSVGSGDPRANAAVADLTARVAARTGLPGQHLVATGPRGGAARLRAAVGDRRPLVQPLFIAPGTLWDAAVDALTGTAAVPGVPLGTAVAPLVTARAAGTPVR